MTIVAETVSFERRFQGFADGALGGYAAGVAARGIDGPAEANLRSLPPMERDLELAVSDDGSVELRHDETLVLELHPSAFDLHIPDVPSLDDAEAANRDPVHAHGPHLYPACFTCGPDREAGDGLRLFMGQAPGRDGILLASWTPDERLAQGQELPPEFVWAALDCPTIWAAWLTDDGSVHWPAEGRFTVLARQRVERLAPVPTGEPAIVTAWPISHEGRKHKTGATIHAPEGELLARAESLLIDVERGA
jgi:hypothetical protein